MFRFNGYFLVYTCLKEEHDQVESIMINFVDSTYCENVYQLMYELFSKQGLCLDGNGITVLCLHL